MLHGFLFLFLKQFVCWWMNHYLPDTFLKFRVNFVFPDSAGKALQTHVAPSLTPQAVSEQHWCSAMAQTLSKHILQQHRLWNAWLTQGASRRSSAHPLDILITFGIQLLVHETLLSQQPSFLLAGDCAPPEESCVPPGVSPSDRGPVGSGVHNTS